MDYEKKYNELVEKLKKASVDNDWCDERFCCVISSLFPELKEGDDKRMAKHIIDIVKCKGYDAAKDENFYAAEIAWLEKQGEQEYHCTGVGEPKEATGVLKQLLDEEKSWSKEDEKMCNDIIRDITIDKSMCKHEVSKGICDEQIEWLKQLKYRIGG